MSCQKYTEWQPKNICNKTTCPISPPPCNSDQDLCLSVKDGCDFKFYRVTITNLYVGPCDLIDVYSNTWYLIEPKTKVDIYLPYESKNLILQCFNEDPFIKLLQPCLINTTINSFNLNIIDDVDDVGNITFKKTIYPSTPIPPKIYKVKINSIVINKINQSNTIMAAYNDIICGDYGYVWLPQGSKYQTRSGVFTVPPSPLLLNECEFNTDTPSEGQNVKEISTDINENVKDLQDKFNKFNKFKKFNK